MLNDEKGQVLAMAQIKEELDGCDVGSAVKRQCTRLKCYLDSIAVKFPDGAFVGLWSIIRRHGMVILPRVLSRL